MTKTILFSLSAFLFLGCSAIDDAINNIASAGVSAEDISAKEKVIIINDVSLSGCVLIKNGLIDADNLVNAETLFTEVGVTCATYGKTAGIPGNLNVECTEEYLADWLDDANHETIADIGVLEGEKACVVGADL